MALYKNQVKINILNSKILELREKDKEYIKSWISPIGGLKAKLLYSFHYNDNKTNLMDIAGKVRLFHRKCDNKKGILVIYRSKNQIFGRYIQLCFKSNDSYGKDNKSFYFH